MAATWLIPNGFIIIPYYIATIITILNTILIPYWYHIDTILIPYWYHIDTILIPSNVVPSSKLGSTPSPGRPLDPSRGFVLAGLATGIWGSWGRLGPGIPWTMKINHGMWYMGKHRKKLWENPWFVSPGKLGRTDGLIFHIFLHVYPVYPIYLSIYLSIYIYIVSPPNWQVWIK